MSYYTFKRISLNYVNCRWRQVNLSELYDVDELRCEKKIPDEIFNVEAQLKLAFR